MCKYNYLGHVAGWPGIDTLSPLSKGLYASSSSSLSTASTGQASVAANMYLCCPLPTQQPTFWF